MACTSNVTDCGHYGTCISGACSCMTGFVKSSFSKRDCRNPDCVDPFCLQCATKASCIRCVNFIEKGTGKCLNECPGNYNLVMEGAWLGKVCGAKEQSNTNLADNTLYLAIIIGVVGLVVLCLVVACIVFIRIKRNKGKDSASSSTRINGAARNQKRKQTSHVYSNAAYVDNYDEPQQSKDEVYTITKVNSKEEYLRHVEELKPHGPTFIEMMNETKRALKELPLHDPNSQKYKNMLHQLWRVMTLINKRDPIAHMPPDGCSLMSWAKKTLKRFQLSKQQHATNGTKPKACFQQPSGKMPSAPQEMTVLQLDRRPSDQPGADGVDDSYYADLKKRQRITESGKGRPKQVPVFEVMV
ncbi:uncharacterized protein LOC135490528 isoform X1 [Lineus longissimus]|uniref:uncharacterized protein LOC135490528 isoform X1 n=1 Tax=Lineus longissimus TaxID=88925 RepID=UPI002B4D9DE8